MRELLVLCCTMSFWTSRTVAFGVVRRFTAQRFRTSAASPSTRLFLSTKAPAAEQSLCGLESIQESVVEVLNELFDPAEVARGNALAKLSRGKKKKKKKKKKSNDDASEEPEEPQMSEEEKKAIGDAAAEAAQPFSLADAMVTPATRPDFGDYQVNAAMGLAKAVGMNPR